MKKKISAIFLIAALALSMAACGGSKEAETEAAETTEAAAEETEAASESADTEADSEGGAVGGMVTDDGEYIDEMFVEGKVSYIDGTVIGIDTGDGSTVSVDIADTDVDEETRADLIQGAYVETSYLDIPDAAQPYAANYILVLMNVEEQADSEGVNPTVYGTVTYIDINDLTIRDANGTEITFDNSISREVTFSSISAGTEVRVTYMGSIYKENQVSDDNGSGSGSPLAIKVVSEDAANSEEALADYLSGPVSSITEDSITVDTSFDSFTFVADPSILQGIEESQNVRVYYEGVLGENRTAQATAVTLGS